MSEGYKKAALRIHGLSESDRRWVLDKLPERERNELGIFLAQLSEMKVPGGSPVFADLIDKASASYQDTANTGRVLSPSDIDVVNNAGLSTMTSMLASEPDWMVALVLVSGEWDWTESYVQSLDDDRRSRIYALIKATTPHPQPKLRDAIIELLARALSTNQPETSPDAISRFSALFGKLGVKTSAVVENPGRAP